MPCVPDGYSYGGVDQPSFPWENWAGTVGRQLAHWYSPASLTDLADVVRRATMNGVELHALLDPANLDFGPQPVGTTGGTRTVRFTNDGVADLHTASIVIEGANPGDFTVEPASSCLASPVLPEGHCAVEVRFAPGPAR